jgi:hypothetical protein
MAASSMRRSRACGTRPLVSEHPQLGNQGIGLSIGLYVLRLAAAKQRC